MLDVSPEEITDGPLGRALAVLAAPMVVQHLVLVGQQVVDVFWVGRLGGEAVAAIGLIAPVVGLLGVGTRIGSAGGQVLVSQRIGADDPSAARRAATHAIGFAAGTNVVLAAVVSLTAGSIVGLFDPGGTVASLAASYLAVLAFSNVFSGVSDMVEASYVGAGDSRTPMVLNFLAIGVNLGLDPFLIFGWGPFPQLGIEGAALATLIGYGTSAVVGLTLLFSSYTGFSLRLDSFRPDSGTARELLEIGLPAGGQSAARQFARLVVVWVVSTVGGGAALAAYTIGARIATVVFVPAQALGSASTTVVGQNLGADRPDRATRATWLGVGAGAIGLGLLGVGQWLFPTTLAELFVPGIGGETLAFTVTYLQILAYGYWALGTIYTVQAGFDGAGRTEIGMYATMLQYWAVRVPLAAAGAFLLGMGVSGPFWAITVSNVVAALGLVGYFWRSTDDGMLRRAAENASASAD
ncbi:MATE family efflux transporter [Halobaculum sp. MBLA0143]|uniref:MATE family efflux transporter n=1 Tax=Halobaculum sp. MBLA0143 TaxID=3079933 RepID=UPI0035259303